MTLEEIKQARAKITPGPWYIEGEEIRYDYDPDCTDRGISDCSVQVCILSRISEKLDNNVDDREFIAKSPEYVDWLVDRVEKLEANIACKNCDDAGCYKCILTELEVATHKPKDQG